MKKILVMTMFSLMVILGSVDSTYAKVFYNKATDAYVSTDENDGVLSFGGTVYKADGTIFGLSIEDGQYLENIVPTDDSAIKTTSVIGELNGTALSKNEGKASTVLTHNYKPEKQGLVFKWSKADQNSIGTVNIDVVDVETGKIVARGYNLKENQLYKTTVEVENAPLQIQLSSNYLQKGMVELVMSSSSSKEAEKKEPFLVQENLLNASYTTGIVPKNINGNQGLILASYRIKSLGHRLLETTFASSTNNMSTINLAYEVSGAQFGYKLNLPLGSSVKSANSFGWDTLVDIKLSTNSNQGKATLNFYERLYPN